MSIVTTAQAVPNRLFSLYAFLIDSENGESRAKFEAWATPPSLSASKSQEESDSSTTLFVNSLSEAKRLGLIEEEDGRLRVTSNAKTVGSSKAPIEDRFRSFMLQTLFDPARAEETGHAAFMLAMCWFLDCSPLHPLNFSEGPQNRIKFEIGDNNAPQTELTSVNRYQNFVYWARHLGFATIVGSAGDDAVGARQVFVDPTRAIAAALPDIFGSETTLSADTFLSRLSAIYPVFEGGSARKRYDALRKAAPTESGTSRLSIATSFALKRLANRQIIALEAIADAPSRILNLGMNVEERVSQITLKVPTA